MTAAQDARKIAYRRVILSAAEKIFAAQGYEGAKMQDVASEAGLALGTLYNTFAGKEELFGEIHTERGNEMLDSAIEHTKTARSPYDALRLGIESYVNYLVEHPHYLRIHLRESQPWALTPKFTTETQRSQWRQGLEMIVAVFRSGIASGAFVDDDPDRMARMMLASHQVHLVDWVERGAEESPTVLTERMLAYTQRVFCRQ